MKVRKKANGKYEVRWRDGRDGPHRARTFNLKGDAEKFAARMVRERQLGEALISEDTFADWCATWWERHEGEWEANTERLYAYLINTHIAPYLGSHRLRELTLDLLEDWKAARLRAGAGRGAIAKAVKLLRQVLKAAVATDRISRNPAEHLALPRTAPHDVTVLSPAEVERLRSHLPQGDAALVGVLAYAGLRPGEALALRWTDVAKQLRVRGGKTGARTVCLLGPLARDLAEWRMARGRPADGELVFPRKADEHSVWTRGDWNNWRRRVFGNAALAALGRRPRPYDLRHSFASLLLYEGRSLPYVAEQLGHSVVVCARTYAHVVGELEAGGRRVKAETAIRTARKARLEEAV